MQNKYFPKDKVIKSVKIALASFLAIALAGELGLKYSATAGIITVLSIQNTKRETLKSAFNRGAAFLCALFLAAVSFRFLDYTLTAFGVYLFFFALICLRAGWAEAIAMDSVLITHFLTEQTFAPAAILNEAALFLIGTGAGILVNLHLRKKESLFRQLSDEADNQIKAILHRMSLWLPEPDKSSYDSSCFVRLEHSLERARLCAASNYNNAILDQNTFELDYVNMREQQSIVLQGIYENIKAITYLPEQALQVAALLAKIEQDYHKDNTVESLQLDLNALLMEMKAQPLPQSREEFEARAILFYILKQLEKLLHLKRTFILHAQGLSGGHTMDEPVS